MKVRLEDQRVVYRLSETEKKVLSENGDFGITLHLPDSKISYQITIHEGSSILDYTYINDVFTMLLPKAYLERWDEEKVGFEEQVGELHLVVEKDLKRSKKRNKS